MLCRLLWDTGLVGAPKEYLNPMQIRDWELRLGSPLSRMRHLPLRGPMFGLAGRWRWSRGRLRTHLDRIRERRTGGSGWFGLKIHRHHLERWFPDDAPERLLGPIRWIAITRGDRVAQAVSWVRARQTGQWVHHQRPLRRPRYDRGAIARALERIRRDEDAWARAFARRGTRPLRLTYEAVAADPQAAARQVLAWLDVPDADRVSVPRPTLQPQSDALGAEWIARFRAGR